jgi:hypothetical protein
MLLAGDRRALFTAVVMGASNAHIGAKIRLAVESSRFHYFDPESGEIIRGESAPRPTEAAGGARRAGAESD